MWGLQFVGPDEFICWYNAGFVRYVIRTDPVRCECKGIFRWKGGGFRAVIGSSLEQGAFWASPLSVGRAWEKEPERSNVELWKVSSRDGRVTTRVRAVLQLELLRKCFSDSKVNNVLELFEGRLLVVSAADGSVWLVRPN